MEKITVAKAEELIKKSNGKFITVSFIKRTNSELRVMNCRVGVKKNLKGTGRKPKAGLVRVFDMTKKEYRNINVSGLRTIKALGKEYAIE